MGGTAGLFLGASLLSFVEIFYYFFVRLSTDVLRRRKRNGRGRERVKSRPTRDGFKTYNYPYLD